VEVIIKALFHCSRMLASKRLQTTNYILCKIHTVIREGKTAILLRYIHTYSPAMTILSPAYDNKIVRKYSARTIEHKLENKTALQEELKWIPEPKQPLICLPCGMTDQLGGDLLEKVLPGIMELPVNIVIRGRGSKKYGELFSRMSKEASHRIAIMQDDETSVRKMLAGSDIAMFFSETADSDILENTLRYGVIPVAMPHEVLHNYNPIQESGNAFVYEKASPWLCFASLVRALETCKFPYDWRTIQRHAIESMDRSTVEEITN
jgi:starch synthase